MKRHFTNMSDPNAKKKGEEKAKEEKKQMNLIYDVKTPIFN